MTKIINFFGGPSAGKSTMAAKLFAYLKEQRQNVEYAPEYAKDLVWSDSIPSLDDQLYIFGKQHHRLYRLLGKVDWVVTDSPLLLSLHYAKTGNKHFNKMTDNQDGTFTAHGWSWHDSFNRFVLETFNQYDNINFEVVRGNRKFVQAGRIQSEEKALLIDDSIHSLLEQWKIKYKSVSSFEEVINNLFGRYFGN